MDRALLLDHLAMAERHVAEGERIIARQREIVAQLTRDGHAGLLSKALDLLSMFEETQAAHVTDRNRLRKELGL